MRFLTFILFFMSIASIVYSIDNKLYGKRSNNYILLLSSYSYDNPSGTELAKNIRNNIELNNKNLFVNIGYAGIGKQNSFLNDYFGMQFEFSNGKMNSDYLIPSVLILLGDEAWMLYRTMNLREQWVNVPIVLCGVKENIMKDYSHFYTNVDFADSLMTPTSQSQNKFSVTGVILKDNTASTLSMISSLLPDFKEVNYVTNRKYQDEYTLSVLKKEITKNYPHLQLNVHYQTSDNTDSLRNVFSLLPVNSPLILRHNHSEFTSSSPIFLLSDSNINRENIIGGYHNSLKQLVSKTVESVLQIYNGVSAADIPFAYVGDDAPRLNRKLIEDFKLEKMADKLPDIIYTNIPPPFFIKYISEILSGLLIITILIILIIYYYRSNKYSKELMDSFDRFKRLYNEYQTVYENIPVGLALFDKNGKLMSRNSKSDLFYKYIDNPNSHLTDITNIKTPYLETIYKEISDEQSGEKNTLSIMIDRSNVEQEKEAKYKIFNQLVFAMETSGLGVAQYNLCDNKGFSTDIWKKHLYLNKNTTFEDVHKFIIPQDYLKITEFIEKAVKGEASNFEDIIRIYYNNQIHWLRYAIQVLKYAPQDSEVLIVELVMNIDQQKIREYELALALQKSQESYHLKNAFIINMDEEIRVILNELNYNIQKLASSSHLEYAQLAKNIENSNCALLFLLNNIIELSKSESEKPEAKA